MSAPKSSGFWMYGLRNVLSTTTSMPCSCATLATFRISTRLNVGLLGVSIHISFVSPDRMSSLISNSMLGEKVT